MEFLACIAGDLQPHRSPPAAARRARRNRLRTSRNLTLGSALASIGFTIPAVAIISLFAGWTLVFGLDAEGAVHLVIFAVYLFTVLVP